MCVPIVDSWLIKMQNHAFVCGILLFTLHHPLPGNAASLMVSYLTGFDLQPLQA